MKSPWILTAWLLVIELGVILLLVPGTWTERAIARESALVEQWLGVQTRDWIEDRADGWFQASIIDSGFYASAHHTLIPTEEEKAASRGMRDMGAAWFVWIEGRLDALVSLVRQFYARVAMVLVWAPYLLILFVPAAYDGVMTRRIKRTNFDYASPVLHRYSLRGIALVAIGLFIAFSAPFALNPLIIPVAMMVCCVLIGLALSNLQKRI